MLVTIRPTGNGVNKDLLPSELAPGQWSDALNMRMFAQFAQKRSGMQYGYNSNNVTPYGVMAYATPSDRFLVKLGKNLVYADDVTAQTNVTPFEDDTGMDTADIIASPTLESGAGILTIPYTVNPWAAGDQVVLYGWSPSYWNGVWTITSVVPGNGEIDIALGSVAAGIIVECTQIGRVASYVNRNAFTGTEDAKWTGGVLNGIAIISNGVNSPCFWSGDTATAFQRLLGWTAGDTCVSMRTYRDFLIALGPTLSGVFYPHNIVWSDAAEPGSIPIQWTASITNQAGDSPEASETAGHMVDGLAWGDIFIAYKEDARYGVQFIGGNDVMRVFRLPGDDGLFSQNCIANTPKGQVFLTSNLDVMIHSGGEAQSIATGRVHRYLADNIDDTYGKRAFLSVDQKRSEVHVFFPSSGSSVCDKRLVWNWNEDTWAIFSAPNATCGASGLLNESVSFGTTWASTTDTWATATATWGTDDLNTQQQQFLIMGVASQCVVDDVGTDDLSSPISAYLEKTGLCNEDPDSIKVLSRSRPQVKAPAGTNIVVYHGSAMNADDTPTYASSVTFTTGTSTWADAFADGGRYMAVKFDFSEEAQSETNPPSMRAYDIEFAGGGRF